MFKVLCFLRFTNIIHETKTNVSELWKITEEIRVSSLLGLELESYYCSGFMDQKSIMKNNEEFATQTNSTINDQFLSVSWDTLWTSLDMFIYLNSCPYTITPHLQLFRDLFQDYPPNTILLTLNRLVHVARDKNLPFEKEFSRIQRKFRGLLNLKYTELDKLTGSCKDDCNISSQDILNYPNLQTITNHPVHVLVENNELSPSAFIPFCAVGKQTSPVGTSIQIEYRNTTFCNSFKPKLLKDQICYEIDVNQFITEDNKKEVLRYGLSLAIDENEDRQVSEIIKNTNIKKDSNVEMALEDFTEKTFKIYLNTLGM